VLYLSILWHWQITTKNTNRKTKKKKVEERKEIETNNRKGSLGCKLEFTYIVNFPIKQQAKKRKQTSTHFQDGEWWSTQYCLHSHLGRWWFQGINLNTPFSLCNFVLKIQMQRRFTSLIRTLTNILKYSFRLKLV